MDQKKPIAVLGISLCAFLGLLYGVDAKSTDDRDSSAVHLRSRVRQLEDSFAAFKETLPEFTKTALQDDTSPQTAAYEWLAGHPTVGSLEVGEMTQLFALATIHYALDGPNWTREPVWGGPDSLTNWLNYSHPECNWDSSWTNVCNENGQLITLNLDNVKTTAAGLSMPPEIGLLKSLVQVSYLVDMQVTIDNLLPAEHFVLPQLQSISMLSWGGTIPTQIGNIASTLTSLSIYHNYLFDSTEGSPDAYGALPTQMGLCTILTALTLHRASFTGFLPTQLGNLNLLTMLAITGTQVSGALPSELGQLTLLGQLSIEDNANLIGNLPTELGLLSQLSQLDIKGNGLEGPIPSELVSMPRMWYLDLSNNRFTSNLPSEIGLATELHRLDLRENELQGPIPSEIGQLASGRSRLGLELQLQNNQFSGALPTEIGFLTKLEHFNASYNAITGLVTELGLLDMISTFDMSHNTLRGVLPAAIFEMGASRGREAWELDLSHNSLTGDLSGAAIGLATRLVKLNLADNQLGGQIPTQFGLLFGMDQLRLGANSFVSTIPIELGRMGQLTYLDLSNLPNLTGPIPSEVGLMASLIDMDLSSSGLDGEIPEEIGNLVLMFDLQYMNVSGNPELMGKVPTGLCELKTNQAYCVTRDICTFDFDCNGLCGCDACFCSDVVIARSGEPFD